MLSEVKYGDLHNIRRHNTHKKLQKAYHSQGYELGDLRTDEKVGSHKRASLTHRKTGEKITDDGKDLASPVLPDLPAAILLAKCIRGCGGLETKGLVQSRISRRCVGIYKAWQTDA